MNNIKNMFECAVDYDRIGALSISEMNAIIKMFEENDNGRYRGNWYGIPNIDFMWNGQYSDPTIRYKGKECSCYAVEDVMWERYCEECTETGVEVSSTSDEAFGDYMRDNKEEVIYVTELVLENQDKRREYGIFY